MAEGTGIWGLTNENRVLEYNEHKEPHLEVDGQL